MPLFDLNQSPVRKVRLKRVKDEREIHRLIADNLDVLLGVKFLASEYEFSDGRIDTLGIDENNFPVIVEYKKAKSSEVILQALFYKNWLLDHRADFELLCRNKLKESVKIDWSNPRVIVIAQEFNKWDKFAVQQMGGNIELKTYKLYEDNRLYLKDLIMKEKEKREVMPTDIEGYIRLRQPRKEITKIFEILTRKIEEISDDIIRVVAKTVVSYRTTRNFASIELQKTKITVHLNFQEMPEERDTFSLYSPKRKHCHLNLTDKGEIDVALRMIRKAYQDTL
ncbi:MAG: hypothetical protein AOA66_1475 [Candidatus Bathyarchaeota archaeon BA2]|nr:MAG: hypothetical protein AOA66_1475 [Candidatus Bathyarchaeota archaeon BA2]